MTGYDYNDEQYHFGSFGAGYLQLTHNCGMCRDQYIRNSIPDCDPFELLSSLEFERTAHEEGSGIDEIQDEDEERDELCDKKSTYTVKVKGEVTMKKVEMLRFVCAELSLQTKDAADYDESERQDPSP